MIIILEKTKAFFARKIYSCALLNRQTIFLCKNKNIGNKGRVEWRHPQMEDVYTKDNVNALKDISNFSGPALSSQTDHLFTDSHYFKPVSLPYPNVFTVNSSGIHHFEAKPWFMFYRFILHAHDDWITSTQNRQLSLLENQSWVPP